MADHWQELADERRVIVTRTRLWEWDLARRIVAGALAGLTLLACLAAAYDLEDPNSKLWFALGAVFAIPLALLAFWRVRFEVGPREVIRHAGPVAFLTRRSVPLSQFSSVVCDYDRRLEDASKYSDGELDGPETIGVRYCYRVTLEGENVSWRLGEFQTPQQAERLALTLASRFGLTLVNLQDRPSVQHVREVEHIGSWIVVNEVD